MKKITLVILLIFSMSCKNEKQNTEIQDSPKKVEQKDSFVLKINAVVEYDDKFVLHYLDDGQKNITTENSVTVQVSGSDQPQELRFQIKEEILPTRLFLSFGNDERQQKINFLTTELSYGDELISIEKEKFIQYFIPNQYVIYDNESITATTKIIGDQYKPRFDSRELLIDRIYLKF